MFMFESENDTIEVTKSWIRERARDAGTSLFRTNIGQAYAPTRVCVCVCLCAQVMLALVLR